MNHSDNKSNNKRQKRREIATKFLTSISIDTSDITGSDLLPSIASGEHEPPSQSEDQRPFSASSQQIQASHASEQVKSPQTQRQLTAETFLRGIVLDDVAQVSTRQEDPDQVVVDDVMVAKQQSKDNIKEQINQDINGQILFSNAIDVNSNPLVAPNITSVDSKSINGEIVKSNQKLNNQSPFLLRRHFVNGRINIDQKDNKIRVFYVLGSNQPVMVSSVLRSRDAKKKHMIDRFTSLDNLHRKKSTESYAHFLNPAQYSGYDANFLDDPQLKTGRHKTVITLQSYITSIIQYAKASELKEELNDQFYQKHEDLEEGITLSKIRNLKMHLLAVAMSQDLELSSVAKAYVFLEKLILTNYVTKQNRKAVAGACLLLAVKINDRKEVKYAKLLDALEKELELSAKQIRLEEFHVFLNLEFNLLIPDEEYMPHLQRLIYFLDYNNLQEYLDGKISTVKELPYL